MIDMSKQGNLPKDYERLLAEAEELRGQFMQERLREMQNEMKNDEVLKSLRQSLKQMRDAKPNDRSEADRRYAVAITEMEKVIAYFDTWIARA
jgi:hypothetical protein